MNYTRSTYTLILISIATLSTHAMENTYANQTEVRKIIEAVRNTTDHLKIIEAVYWSTADQSDHKGYRIMHDNIIIDTEMIAEKSKDAPEDDAHKRSYSGTLMYTENDTKQMTCEDARILYHLLQGKRIAKIKANKEEREKRWRSSIREAEQNINLINLIPHFHNNESHKR